MLFWIIALAAATLAGLALARPLIFGRGGAAPRAAYDAQVFRDQLRELEREVERGVVPPEDAETTRIEISRRLLNADADVDAAEGARPAPRMASMALAAVVVLSAPISAGLIYWDIGAPGARDTPLTARGEAGRPSQEEAEQMLAGREIIPPAGPDAQEFEQMAAQLEDRMKAQPDDPQGAFLYARTLMNLGRFAEAWPNFQRAIELRGGDAETYAGLAEGMILAAGGYISPEAEANILQILRYDPTNPSARYYLGRLHVQNDDNAIAAEIWGRLLEDSPPDAPWVAPIQAELNQIAPGAGGPEILRGPSQAEMAAAGNLSEAERQAMVLKMVTTLEERLMSEGGSVGEWRRLIRSYGVMGKPRKAREAMQAARKAFADDPAALSQLESDGPAAQPGGAPGPSSEDMAAAADMPAENRAAMIEKMVARLDDRLASQGGSVEEWLRLISSYGVMGQADEARGAYARARAALADDAEAMRILESAVEGAPRTAAPATPAPAPSDNADRGPTQEDIAAAADMEAGDRQAMIRNMVTQLHDRLAEEGAAADVNQWGKLMRSYSVLGEKDKIRAAYDEATGIYAGQAISLAYLKEAALLAGVKVE